jgi:hypothetical protein
MNGYKFVTNLMGIVQTLARMTANSVSQIMRDSSKPCLSYYVRQHGTHEKMILAHLVLLRLTRIPAIGHRSRGLYMVRLRPQFAPSIISLCAPRSQE